MIRWHIEPVGEAKGASKRKVLLQATAADLQALVRKFGALCGRPKREKGGEYNYSLLFHAATPRLLSELEAELKRLSGSKASPPPLPEPFPARPSSAVKEVEKELPRSKGGAQAPARASAGTAPPRAPLPRPEPAKAVPVPEKAGPAVAGAITAVAGAPAGGAFFSRAWDPTRTLETLIVGSFNRFAHAAGTSVVSNPGAMYNPLLIYGAPGTGKSHVLNAVGLELQKLWPKEAVWAGSGYQLTQAAARLGKDAAAWARALQASRALLIDDVQLMEVTEGTKAALAKALHAHLDSGKQVVLTSVYAPRALAGLEEALQFRLASGWSVDLKTPGPPIREQILSQVLSQLGFDVQDSDRALFQGQGAVEAAETKALLDRCRAFRQLRARLGQSAQLKDVLPLLLAPEADEAPASASELAAKAAVLPAPPPGEAGPLLLLHPAGCEAHAQWALRQLHEAARALGWPLKVRLAASKSYDPSQVYGLPFGLAQECLKTGVAAALLVGPPPGSELAKREGEFFYAVSHLLEDIGCALAWLPQARLKQLKRYPKIGLDLYPKLGGQGA